MGIPESSASARPVVLLVDDEEEIREVLARHLQEDGIEVRQASKVSEAWASIAARKPDVVVTDLRMPGESGESFIEDLRNWDAQIPIIVMTGYPSLESAVTAVQSGVFDYLLKPFPELRLVSKTVAQALRVGRLERENREYGRRLAESLEKLLQVEKARDSLTHLLARDLREQFGELRLALDVLREALPTGSSEEYRGLLEAAAARANAIFSIADRLSETELLRTGECFLDLEPCDLREVLVESREWLLCLDEHRERAVSIELQETTPSVSADRDLLRSVIDSALQRALSNTPQGHSVVVRIEASGDGRVLCRIAAPNAPDAEGSGSDRTDPAGEDGSAPGPDGSIVFCEAALAAIGGQVWEEELPGAGRTIVLALSPHV